MTPEQCREARKLLGWTIQRAGVRSGISGLTVRQFESGRRQTREANVAAIRTALEAAGVEFIPENGGGGVRLRERAA
ncbi:helix-turn-helix domain-containing protein [Roseomonas sp. BN140053]|uniref:helix-turn-helix domain-containing protein n=1 Tax=Roseomonas sp. BN140053 TaxID=3391898 RepID=UPI0039EC57F9